MTVLEVGHRKRYHLLLLPSIFFMTLIPLALLFTLVLGLGSVGGWLAGLAAFLLTLLAFLIMRQDWS
jgi:Zn-dependent protease with chaperone function